MPSPGFSSLAPRHSTTSPSSLRTATATRSQSHGAASGMPRFVQSAPAVAPAARTVAAAPAAMRTPATETSATRTVAAAAPQSRSSRAASRSTVISAAAATPPTVRHDRWEHEADRLASQARRIASPATADLERVQRRLQPTPAHPGLGPSPPSIADTALYPLPRPLRRQLEALAGFDLGHISVTTGPGAERTALALHARAFTQHGRIHLGPTASLSDADLLAHETAHALQQTLPAPQLARLGLSTAPADSILRQPFGRSPFAIRHEAREALLDPLSLPGWLMSRSIRRVLSWMGDDGLALRLTRAVPEALQTSLAGLRLLEGQWRFVRREIESFSARQRFWNYIQQQAGRTDDPSLVTATRGAADQLPALLGTRWSILQHLIDLTARIADFGVRRWEGGLTSLAPGIAAMLDDLPADIAGTFDDFSDTSWVQEALRTALGCPSQIRTMADITAWIQRVRQSADALIQPLAGSARHLVTAQYDTTSLTKLAALHPAALSLATDLRNVAAIMGRSEGVATEYKKLTALLPPTRQQIATLGSALGPPAQGMTYAFGNLGFSLQGWGHAPVLDAFFPNEFTWMDRLGASFDPWISQQEPQLLLSTQESLGGIDRWSGLVAETAAEAATLDEPAPDYDSGGFINFFRRTWAWFRDKKEKFINYLLSKVPLFLELKQHASQLWEKAKPLFSKFTDRVFKEGQILAPLWEFFIGVLELALPNAVAFVRDIANHAGSLLGKVLKHPVQFLINLGKGIGRGLVNFGSNIGNHLLNGLVDWLLGEFELQPPPTVGKIIGALMNLIGFSRRAVSEQIAEYLKAKGRPITAEQVDTRLEQAIKIGATGLRWLGYLFRGQFAEFWQEIKQHLNQLWQWAVDRAVSYAIDQLKKHLPPKLAQLIDPTGIMMIFNAVKALYDAIQTAIRYAQQMLAIVREVFRAVREIADGQIDRAAQFVETAAANGLSVALGFLARFAGLEAIVNEFKKFLNEIRKFVTQGIAALVRATGGIWESIYDAVEQAKNWLANRRAFTDRDGARRNLGYDKSGSDAVLHVTEPASRGMSARANKLQTLGEFLNGFKPADDHEAGIMAEIARHADDIQLIKDTGSISAARGEQIYIRFNEIVRLLNELGGEHVTPPATIVTWTPITIFGDVHGKKMIAHPLSIDPGDNIGSKPVSTDTKLWSLVKGFQRGGDTAYIKGHLLNHHLHGPGVWKNMVPIARTTNTEMEGVAEGKVKEAVVDQNKFVHYEVNMVFGQHSKTPQTTDEKELPSKIEIFAEELKYKSGKWVPNGVKIVSKTLTNDIR